MEHEIFGPIIFKYTRVEAIADGALFDVTDTAREAGFKVPVAVTAEVWSRYVKVTPAAEEAGNDLDGRLWDVLWMAHIAAHCTPQSSEVVFPMLVVTDSVIAEEVQLKMVCGPGDDGEPVITILLPGED